MHTLQRKRRFDIIDYVPVILGIIAVTLVIVILSAVFSHREKAVKESELKELSVGTQLNFKPFKDGIVYIEEGNLYYLDDRNEIMWGFSGASDDMVLYTSESRVGLTIGKKLQVVDASGKFIFSKEFDKSIANVAFGDKLTAVSLSQSDDTIVLNESGEEIDCITSNTNATIIRFGVYNNDSIWVITVENSGYAPTYQLLTYKYSDVKTQTVSFEDDGQMMYSAAFDDNLCYIFGTEYLMIRDCDYTGTVNYNYTVNGYDVAAMGKIDKTMHFLLLNNGYMKAVTRDGVKNLKCDEKVLFAVVSQKNYYAFSNYFMYKLNTAGKCTRYRFPLKIDDLVAGDGYVIIRSGEKLYRYAYGE